MTSQPATSSQPASVRVVFVNGKHEPQAAEFTSLESLAAWLKSFAFGLHAQPLDTPILPAGGGRGAVNAASRANTI